MPADPKSPCPIRLPRRLIFLAGCVVMLVALGSTGCTTLAEQQTKQRVVNARTISDLKLDLVWIAPGKFLMGSPENSPDHKPDEQQHQVTLTRAFWLGRTLVTQRQYLELMGDNPSLFKAAGLDAPVENVSWYDAVSFCLKLTSRERSTGNLPPGYVYNLPTEAEWEYACRAGTTVDDVAKLDSYAWYKENSGETTHPVAQKAPNAWGLFDMHGNAFEWCLDWYVAAYPSGPVVDPVGPKGGENRVSRGGSWFNEAVFCNSAYRYISTPDTHARNVGFRLALVPAK